MLSFALVINREISKSKVEIFWDLFDTNCDGFLNRYEIETMLDTVLGSSVKM
jgi:hypothetical protein